MSQKLTFPRWIVSGYGWQTSHEGNVTITVNRAYGSNNATVTATWNYWSVGGAERPVTAHLVINGTDNVITLVNGIHYAGDVYTKSQTISVAVGSGGGNLSGSCYINVEEPNATSTTKSNTLTFSLEYPSKGYSSLVVSDAVLGEPVTLNVTRYDASFSHTISCRVGSKTITICTRSTVESISWTPLVSDYADQITASDHSTATYTITTYDSNGNSIGAASVRAQMYLPESIVPEITAVEFSDVQRDFANVYVKGLSKITATITAASPYGASISNYYFKLAGETYSSNNNVVSMADVAAIAGVFNAEIGVIDSRGRSAIVVRQITIFDLYVPRLEIGVRVDGQEIIIDYTWDIAPVNNLNSKRIEFKVKRISDEHISTYTPTLNVYGGKKQLILTPGDADTETYQITATLSDKKASDTKSVNTGIVCFSRLAGGKGAAFFKEAEREGLDINGDVYFKNLKVSEMIDYIVEEGSGGAENNGSTGSYYYRRWNSGKIELWARRTGVINFTGTWIAPLKNGTITGSNNGYVTFVYPAIFTEPPKVQMHVSQCSTPIWLVPSGNGTKEYSVGDYLITASNSNINNVSWTVDLYAVQY